MLSASRLCIGHKLWASVSRSALVGFTRSVANASQTVDELLDKLDTDVRRFGRVNQRDVLRVFNTMKNDGFAVSTHGLLLLRCCGSLLPEIAAHKRTELIKQIWSSMIEKNFKLDISHYNALLTVYLENDHPFNPNDLLAEMTESGLTPNRVTYQRLIRRYCQNGDMEGAVNILQTMKEKNIPINEAVFNSLIVGHCKTGDLGAAMEVLEQMKTAGVDPSNATYRTLLCSLGELVKSNEDAVQKMKNILDSIDKQELNMTDKDYLDVAKSIAMVDESSPLIDVVFGKFARGSHFLQDAFNIVLELVNYHKIDTALKLYLMLPVLERNSEMKTAGAFLLHQMFKCGVEPSRVIKVCDELKAKNINDQALRKAVECAFEHCDLNTCKMFLNTYLDESKSELKAHFFWPLLVKSETDDQIFDILSKDMVSLAFTASLSQLLDTFNYVWPKITSDFGIFYEKCKEAGYSDEVLLSSYMKYLLREKSLSEVVEALNLERFVNTHLAPVAIHRELANAFCNTGDVENVIKVLEKMSACRSGAYACGRFLNQVVSIKGKSKALDAIQPLLLLMEASDVFISTNMSEVIRNKLELTSEQEELLLSVTADESSASSSDEEEDEVASNIKHVTVADLEEQLQDFREKGIIARGTMRQLLSLYCRQRFTRRTEEGLERIKDTRAKLEALVKDYTKDGSELSIGTKAQLVEFYTSACQDLDAALNVKNSLPSDIGIDILKVFRLTNLMVEKGRVDEAIKLMEGEANKPRPEATGTMSDSRAEAVEREAGRVLYTTAKSTKSFEQVKKLFDLVLPLKGGAPTSSLVGPLVKVHLLNEDYQKAYEQFVIAVEKYGCAPWKVDLMTHAIQTGNSAQLQAITDKVISLHGDANALLDLSIAFIKSNKLKEAKKVLRTPGLRLNSFRVERYARSLAGEDVSLLESLISLTKDMTDLKRDELYHQLLMAYVRAGDIEKGLDVWTQMQEDNVTPCGKTLQVLASFLQEHGREVPFAFKQ